MKFIIVNKINGIKIESTKGIFSFEPKTFKK